MCCNDEMIAGFREEIHELRLMVKELKLERDMLIDELTALAEIAGPDALEMVGLSFGGDDE